MPLSNLNGYWYAGGAVLIWCGFILVSRMGGVSPLLANDVIAIRYLTCAMLVLPVWWFKFRFDLLQWRFLGVSLVGGLAYALCTFRGFSLVPASHAALLLPGLLPLFTTLTAYLLNGERCSQAKGCGVGLISLGVGGLLFSAGVSGEGLSVGHLWLMAGALCWAVFTALVKRWDISPWQATVSLALITCVLYVPVYCLSLPKAISWQSWGDLWWPHIFLQSFYQGVLATVIQMLLFVRAVQLLGPSKMGLMMGVVPILSGFLAVVLLGEPLHLMLVIGLVLVSLGAWVGNSSWGELRAG
ncbi:MAG: EamA family transporter [Gammaproteobacteria bacterium]|nr:MAG: EamA family transporter [Gammaproteobacteria bacterium]